MTPNLRIDFMKAADIPAAVAICRQAFSDHPETDWPAYLKNQTEISGVFFAASVNGQVAGVVGAFDPPWREGNEYSIATLAVDPSFRQNGIGHALMARAEDFIRDTWLKGEPGCVYLTDETKKDNPASQFYEKMGYRSWDNRKDDEGYPFLIKPLSQLNPA